MIFAQTANQIAAMASQFNLASPEGIVLCLTVAALVLTAIAGTLNCRAMSDLVDVLSETD